MKDKTKEILKTVLSIVVLFSLIFLVVINERNKCDKRIKEYSTDLFECERQRGFANIDLRQCKSFLNMTAESLWDCQEKLFECKNQ